MHILPFKYVTASRTQNCANIVRKNKKSAIQLKKDHRDPPTRSRDIRHFIAAVGSTNGQNSQKFEISREANPSSNRKTEGVLGVFLRA